MNKDASVVPSIDVYLLNPDTAEEQLRACALELGVDFDKLVEGAARHFQAPLSYNWPATDRK
jgi:hypothetical protein